MTEHFVVIEDTLSALSRILGSVWPAGNLWFSGLLVFRCALPGVGGDGRRGPRSRQEQRCRQQLHQAAFLLQK